MLRPRIIPSLLIHKGGLVKTINFRNPKYVGDPINAVRIFNEKQVDEMFIADIDTTIEAKVPNYNVIADIASECRMPLCYAGGVTNCTQVEKIISLGVEKVGISSAAISRPQLISEAAKSVGSQSVVVILDVKKTVLQGGYEIFTHGGRFATGIKLVDFVKIAQSMGAGEIIINDIDQDGLMQGYNLDLIDRVYDVINLPLTVLGGAGNHSDLQKLFARYGLIGAAAGSLFVFRGKFRAVLLQYPTLTEKEILYSKSDINS
jgi:cyclase